jgi:hypothetical protein
VSTPTTLDNPLLVLRYVVTQAGDYSMSISGGTEIQTAPVCNSPFDIKVKPNLACASTSSAVGPSLSLATAGRQGSFMIYSRDEFSNDRSAQSDDSFVIRVRQYTGSSFNNTECAALLSSCFSWNTYNTNAITIGGLDKVGSVIRMATGYLASYNVTRAGVNYVWATLAVNGGLQATYYAGSSDFSSAANRRVNAIDQTIDFCASGGFLGGIQNFSSFSARWTGIVVPPVTGVYTFNALRSFSPSRNDRIKLWVIIAFLVETFKDFLLLYLYLCQESRLNLLI